MGDKNVAGTLYDLNGATEDSKLLKLKFFVKLIDVQFTSDLENANNVREVYDVLKNRLGQKEAVPLLQSMLNVVGVDKEKVKTLKSTEGELAKSRELHKNFAFGELMVSLCNSLSSKQFVNLREFFKDDHDLKDHPKTTEDMLWKLQANIERPKFLCSLKKHLSTIGEKECVRLVKDFETEQAKSNKGTHKPMEPLVHTESQHHTDVEGHSSMVVIGRTQTQGQLLGNGAVHVHDGRDGDDERDHAGDTQRQANDERGIEEQINEVPRTGEQGNKGDREENEEQIPQPAADGESTPFDRSMRKKDNVVIRRPRLKKYDESKSPIVAAPVSRPHSLAGVYSMTNHEHGVALIISNETVRGFEKRDGTKVDEENLTETFGFLGYRVVFRRNCSKETIQKLFDASNDLVKENDDSFVCCILSHGGNNYFHDVDGEKVHLRTEDDSLEMMLKDSIKLRGKPKLFFSSCCRGSTGESSNRPNPDGDTGKVIKRGDFAFYYSTLTRETSWRYETKGTVYVNKLCEWLCRHATNTSLSDIQKLVARDVSWLGYYNQVPCSEEQLFTNVYFFEDMAKSPQYAE